jgi:hypothetical protein
LVVKNETKVTNKIKYQQLNFHTIFNGFSLEKQSKQGKLRKNFKIKISKTKKHVAFLTEFGLLRP